MLEHVEDRFDEETQTLVAPLSIVEDEGNSATEQRAFDDCVECTAPSSQTEPLPCKVEVVDVNKLDKDAEANENYFPHSHWSNPCHMSAFIDGKRGDGLEAIPEGSCEEGDSIMWNSLPIPGPAVFSICSPRQQPVLEFQRTLSGALDGRASSSLRGDSPFAADPRMSPCVSGSLNVDNQKRLDTLENVLSLCSTLYNKGRWHELGHILTQMPKQINLQVSTLANYYCFLYIAVGTRDTRLNFSKSDRLHRRPSGCWYFQSLQCNRQVLRPRRLRSWGLGRTGVGCACWQNGRQC